MLNIRSKKKLNKESIDKILFLLKDQVIDVRGKLIYNKDGVATFRMTGKVIPLMVSDQKYTLELNLNLLVRKEYNWVTDQEFGGNVQAWDVVLRDSQNQKINLTLAAFDSIKESLENNVLV